MQKKRNSELENEGQDLEVSLSGYIDSTLEDLEEILKGLELRGDIKSEGIVNRKLAVKEWIKRFESVSRTDLNAIQKVNHDFRLFLQRLEATQEVYEPESRTAVVEPLEQKLEEQNKENARLENELVRLREEVTRPDEESKLLEIQTKQRAREQDDERLRLDREEHEIKSKAIHRDEELSKQFELALANRDRLQKRIVESEQISRRCLEVVMERNKLQISTNLQQASADAEWRQKQAKEVRELSAKHKKSENSLLKRLKSGERNKMPIAS